MDRTDVMNQQWNIPTGTDVVGSDGDKVGEVVAVQPNYIVVEKGFFFPSDYYIPVGAIANYDGNKVYLNVTKDDALHQGWDIAPADREYTTTETTAAAAPIAGTMPTQTAATGYTADMGATDTTVASGTSTDMGATETTAAAGAATDRGTIHDQPFAHQTTGDVAHMDEGETLRVPVQEEELTATKRPVERGDVQITTNVVSEEQQLDVPVTEERVRVERRVMDRPVPADQAAFQEGTIEVPVRGEEVDVEKRVVQTGEVDVTKEAVQRTEQVSDTVRREVVNVEGSGTGLVENAAEGTVTGTAPGERPTNVPTEEEATASGENAPWVARGTSPAERAAGGPPAGEAQHP